MIVGQSLEMVCNFSIAFTAMVPNDRPLSFITTLVSLRMAIGYGLSLKKTAGMSTVLQMTSSESRARNIGLLLAMEGVGFIIGPSICAVLFANYGYEMTFWLSSLIQVFAEFALAIYIPHDSPKESMQKEVYDIFTNKKENKLLEGYNLLKPEDINMQIVTGDINAALPYFIAMLGPFAVELTVSFLALYLIHYHNCS